MVNVDLRKAKHEYMIGVLESQGPISESIIS